MKEEKIRIMSIISYYANQIFKETKKYEFRKSPLKESDLNKKIYIYSAKGEKAIIGYLKVKKVLLGTTEEILKKTGYDKRNDKQEIIDYFGKNNKKCYALELYEVTRLKEKIPLQELRKIDSNIKMPQYLKYIYPNHPIYNRIKKSK